jgi:hypothetical protein
MHRALESAPAKLKHVDFVAPKRTLLMKQKEKCVDQAVSLHRLNGMVSDHRSCAIDCDLLTQRAPRWPEPEETPELLGGEQRHRQLSELSEDRQTGERCNHGKAMDLADFGRHKACEWWVTVVVERIQRLSACHEH